MIAATTESRESTVDMAAEVGLTFPIAYGLREDQLIKFDPWWVEDSHGRYAQPMEFLILRGGTVFGSLYASGPIGRMDVEEVMQTIRGRERRRTGQAPQAQSPA